MDLLPELSARCDLRVIRLGEDIGSDVVEECWTPVPLQEIGAEGRLPLYQMGNNQNHLEVYRTAMSIPGVLTLHDLVLHHFHQERFLITEDLEGYRDRLRTDHGWIGEAVTRPIRWTGYSNAAVFALPAHRELLLRQRGILVHSSWSADVLREEIPEVRVRAVPMGIPLPAKVAPGRALEFRRQHGLPLEAPLLGSFGFQTPIKRTEVAIRALARPELSEAHLVVVGEASPSMNLEAEAREAGVFDRVHILGYVAFDELESAIAATDLCLNLRYPTAGETSASLLRVFALGCPAIVSDYAQFAELPETFAIKVPLGDSEVEALAQQVGQLLGSPDRLLRLGESARRFVEVENSPASAAQAVVDTCEEWKSLDPPGDFVPSIAGGRATSLTVWPRVQLKVTGLESAWGDGEQRALEVSLENVGTSVCLAAESGVGGLALEVQFVDSNGRVLPSPAAWIPMGRDLVPEDSCLFPLELRRPIGEATLKIQVHVIGCARRGPVQTWEGVL